MSDEKGRCRSEVDARRGSPCELLIADAIDRLAADVASIKAKVDAVSPEDVKHFVDSEKAWVALIEERCGVAIRQREEARAEVERLRAELAARPKANPQEILDSSTAAPQPAGVSDAQAAMDKDRAAVQRYCAAPQPAAPAAGWMTEEERHTLIAHLQSLRDQRRAMERGGQTLGYSANPCAIKREADVIDALLARAGSPPVVEVPELPSNHYARSEAERYRAALDKAGVAWEEVPRE